MSPEVIGLLGFAALVVLLLLKVNVAIAMIAVAVAGNTLIINFDAALSRLGQDSFTAPNTYSLSVIPLFILMGLLLAGAGLGLDAYRAIDRFVYRLKGGLAIATIGASALFASVSGSAVASATTMSVVAVPEMRRMNYDDGLSAGSAAVGGTLGAIIPPSAVLVLYGILTEEPIGDLLLGGIVPGVILALALMATAYIWVSINPSLAPTPGSRPDISKRNAVELVWPVPLIFFVSMGGILFGWFTPTEAGGAGAGLALAYGVLTRRLGWKAFLEATSRTIRTSSMIFLLLIGGQSFGFFLAISRIPARLGGFVTDLNTENWIIMIGIFVIYFILGALMDEIAILIIMTPIMYPVVTGQLGYNGVWFGVVTIMMLLTGLITPPVGLITFVVAGATGIPLRTVFRGIIPFTVSISLVIFLLIFVPSLVTWLPNSS